MSEILTKNLSDNIDRHLPLFGRAERAGSGADKIVSGWQYLGLPTPEIEEENRPDYVVLTLKLKNDTPQVGHNTPQVSNNTPQVDHNTPQVGHNTPQVGDNTPQVGHNTPQVGHNSPQVKTKQIELRKLQILDFCVEPKSLTEIVNFFGLKDRRNFMKVYINPMIAEGTLSMTEPDKPTSSKQRYLKIMNR